MEAISSTQNLRTGHAAVTGTHNIYKEYWVSKSKLNKLCYTFNKIPYYQILEHRQ
jgi:hypothetical protein